MTFIITFIALFIERFFHWSHLRNWRWFDLYQRQLSSSSLMAVSPVLVLTLCVFPWALLIGMLYYFLGCCFYGLLQLLFGVIVLLYCLGPANLWVQTFACLHDLQDQDPKVAVDRAQLAFGIALPNDSQAFHQALTKAIFIEANERIFAVIFWFVVFGPFGAVLYRCVSLCSTSSGSRISQLATWFQRILDWLPVRILSFFFALGGHFTQVLNKWKEHVFKGLSDNDVLLTECGINALDVKNLNQLPETGAAEKAALELLDRALVIGLVILALIVLLVTK